MGKRKAALVLESGDAFYGESFGFEGERLGEVIFNTSMTGYQEILTDPSYKGQIIVMTEPHIGNVGTNPDDAESSRIFCEGLVVREASPISSNWRSKDSLQNYLESQKIPAVSGVDTRKLTRILRETGVMRGVISTLDLNVKSLLKKVMGSPQMAGSDLVQEVTCKKTYSWNGSEWRLAANGSHDGPIQHHVVAMDFGIKRNILRCLASRGCNVSVVPAQTSAEEILKLNPDGLFLSNGPGDPAAVTYAVQTIRRIVEMQQSGKSPRFPIFGICLGHQLIGLALGGKTYKLKFGHRGANHPVKNLETQKIEITTQNHGFCVDLESLSGKDVETTHVNLNDQTSEGLRHKTLPIFSVQYHPESSAGPHDSRYLFDDFIKMIEKYKTKKEVHA